MLPEKGHQLLLLGCQFLSHGANIDKKILTPNFFRSIPYFFRSLLGNRLHPCFLFLVSFSHSSLCPAPPPRAGVQVSYVHRSAPGTAFICTSLGGGDRFRPLPERLEHNIPMAGTFSCTSETCTWGADHRKPLHSDPSSRRPPPRITTRGPAPTRRIPAHLETPTVPTHKRDPRITERGIDESVPHRPGGGERVRWRCCSSRGRTADRPTAPDTAEHIDYQSAHTVASH